MLNSVVPLSSRDKVRQPCAKSVPLRSDLPAYGAVGLEHWGRASSSTAAAELQSTEWNTCQPMEAPTEPASCPTVSVLSILAMVHIGNASTGTQGMRHDDEHES